MRYIPSLMAYRSVVHATFARARLLPLIMGCCFWRPVFALDLDIRSSSASLLDFSFLIDHSTVDLTTDNTLIETNINRVGVLTIDVPESGPQFGLALGYAYGDFNNNPLFEPNDMDGWYIGILARGVLYDSGNMAVTMEGRYIYQDISGGDESKDVSLSWNEYALNVTLHMAVTGTLRLVVAPVYGGVDTTYRERGTVNQTVKMDSDNNAGLLAGLRYQLDPREFISLHYQDAVFTGVLVQFQRLF